MTSSDLHRMGVLARRIVEDEPTLTEQINVLTREVERLELAGEERMRAILYLALTACMASNPTLEYEEFWTHAVDNFQLAATWMANDLTRPDTTQIH